jgi:glycosyltransferase involved in cell wall biosynthesis
MDKKKGIFIVWKGFQRRVEVLAPTLGLEIYYFHYPWEEKSKIFKAISFIMKSLRTLTCLFRNKPRIVFVQFPPPPALYCVAFYSWLRGSKYVSDCHFGTTNELWLDWICVKKLLIKGTVIIHNDHLIEQTIRKLNIKPYVVRDGIAKRQLAEGNNSDLLKELGLSPQSYAILPWSFSPDEPLEEVIGAMKMLPEVKFVVTWYIEKISSAIKKTFPPNLLLTGYLPPDEFNILFAQSGVALVLTSMEETQLSGMQEAMAFEIPAVVSDLKTTRFLYKSYPVYVKNDPESIAEGVTYAFQSRCDLELRMKKLRVESEQEFNNQIILLKADIDI